MKTKLVHEMDYQELNDLIEKTYGHEFNIVAEEELGNDSSKTFSFKKEPLDEWETEDLKVFKEKGVTKGWRTNTIMQDMVNNGVLPEGNYVIQICW